MEEEKLEFGKLLLIYGIFSAASLFFGSLFESYFYTLNLEFYQIILSALCLYLPPIIMIMKNKKVTIKEGITKAAILFSLSATVLLFIHNPVAPFISRTLIGVSIFYFWMPFNSVYYGFVKNNAATLGSIYNAISPVLGIVIPVFAGTVAQLSGYEIIFLISIFAFLPLIPIVSKLRENKEFKIEIKKKMENLDGFKTLVVLEGFAINTITPITISTMMLIYFRKPVEFGGFLSATTVFSVLASVIAAKLSDKLKNRKDFIIASSVGFFAGCLIVLFSESAESFFVGVGVLSFFRSVLLPLPLALMVDRSKDLFKTMIEREIMLNAGRVAVIIIGTILVFFFDIRYMIAIQTIGAGAYIAIFLKKLKKLNL
jgi:MFS family permease